MGGSVEAGDGVLGEQDTDAGDVRWRCDFGPTTGAVIECRKDKLSRLMGWSGRNHGNGQRRDSGTVEDDGRVVEILQDLDTECVNQAVADEQCSVNADGLGWCRHEILRLDRGQSRDEIRTAKGDTRRDGKLTDKVEPA